MLTTRATPTIADGFPHTQTRRPAQPTRATWLRPTRGLDLLHLAVAQDWAQTAQQHRCPRLAVSAEGRRGPAGLPHRGQVETQPRVGVAGPVWVGPNARLQMAAGLAQKGNGTGREQTAGRRGPGGGHRSRWGDPRRPRREAPRPGGLYSRPGWFRVLPPGSPGSSPLLWPRRSRRNGRAG